MPGFTTKLNLYKPGGGSSGSITPDETVDIDKLNDNSDKIDAAIGASWVTSTTRPAAPVDGQIIYETDTTNVMIFRSVSARWIPVGTPTATSDATRNALFPSPLQGNAVYRKDLGHVQEYLEIYNVSTNPGGAKVAGWYAMLATSTPTGGVSPLKLFESTPANQTNLTPGAAELFPAGMIYSFTMPYAAKVLLSTTFFWTAGGNAAGHTKIRLGANGNATDELINDRRTGNNAVSGGAIGETLTDVLMLQAGAQKLSAGLTSDGAGFGQAIQNLMYRIQML